MTNSADPDPEANWSGSTLFAKAGHILDHQDQGYDRLQLLKLSTKSLVTVKLLYLWDKSVY